MLGLSQAVLKQGSNSLFIAPKCKEETQVYVTAPENTVDAFLWSPGSVDTMPILALS